MRISGFGRYALTSCVAVAMLAGCGGSQALSSGQPAAPMTHSVHITVVSARPRAVSCDYSVYIACVAVAKGYPAKVQLCFTPSGSGCTSGPSVRWYALEGIRSEKRGKHIKWLVWKFSPNPAYETVDTITTLRRVKNSHGAIMYFQGVEACINGCPYQPYGGYIGIATK